ncbi:calcium-binding protein 2 isoform X1, partial [Tachysurus ichikawai]
MSAASERTPKQVQAAIKKTVEKQKKQLENGEAFGNTPKSNSGRRQSLSTQYERTEDGDEEEDVEAVAETMEQHEKEETDLTPIVDSMFGQ